MCFQIGIIGYKVLRVVFATISTYHFVVRIFLCHSLEFNNFIGCILFYHMDILLHPTVLTLFFFMSLLL